MQCGFFPGVRRIDELGLDVATRARLHHHSPGRASLNR